jgi:hypothetical protein
MPPFAVLSLSPLVLLIAFVVVRAMRRRRAVRRPRDAPPVRCDRCGYPLEGLPLPRCPECGALRGFTVPIEALGIREDELRTRRAEKSDPDSPSAPADTYAADTTARPDRHETS